MTKEIKSPNIEIPAIWPKVRSFVFKFLSLETFMLGRPFGGSRILRSNSVTEGGRLPTIRLGIFSSPRPKAQRH